MYHLPTGSLALLGKWTFFLSRDIKQRQAARTSYVVFVSSHYQSLLGSEALSRTLLLQQLHRLQQGRRFRLFASLLSCFLKTDTVASFLRETVEMFSQFRFRQEKRFGDLFIFYFLRFRIELALLLLALYKSYVSQSSVSIFDPNSGVEEEYFNLRYSVIRCSPLRGEYSHSLIIFRRIFLIILVFECYIEVKSYLILKPMIIHPTWTWLWIRIFLFSPSRWY